MLVKSAPGTRCPMERRPRKYISDTTPMDVPNTTFYRRLVKEGSLVKTKPPKKPVLTGQKPVIGATASNKKEQEKK